MCSVNHNSSGCKLSSEGIKLFRDDRLNLVAQKSQAAVT